MTMKTGAELRFEPGSWQEAAHDVYVGLLVGMGHVYKIFVQMPYEAIFSSSSMPMVRQAGELKVVGVGFGRTGTVSRFDLVGTIPVVFGAKGNRDVSLWHERVREERQGARVYIF